MLGSPIRLAVAAAAVLALALPPGEAAARTPEGFLGVMPQGPLENGDFVRMGGVVGTLRMPLFWFEVEPSAGSFEFSEFDGIVTAAASQGIRVLPVVYGTPRWLVADPTIPPVRSARGRAAWARVARVLVDRYGPGGELWSGMPERLPIRRWQIWNEPNFSLFWRPRPSANGYAGLLRIGAKEIRKADPGATIVAAGLAPNEGGVSPQRFLRRLYRAPGVRRYFDVAAVHPYSSTTAGVELAVRRIRQVMAAAGDAGTPLRVTEVGAASDSVRPTTFDLGAAGQAEFLERTLSRLVEMRREWRVSGIDWFAWQDLTAPDPHCSFCHFAGLFDAGGRPKPSWAAFRRVARRLTSLPVR